MKNLFLLTTALCVATNVWAFAGIGLGLKSSSHKSGVSSIGVHVNGEGQADIQTSCPEHSEWSGIECVCETGWIMNNSVCMPKGPTTCAANNFYWCMHSQTCVSNKDACLALCPTNRLCGEEGNQVCCGEGNLCVNGNKCCYGGDEDKCCNASESTGWTSGEGCCDLSSTSYTSYDEEGHVTYTNCCSNTLQIFSYHDIYGADEISPQLCCAEGSTDYDVPNGGCCAPGNVLVLAPDSDPFCAEPASLSDGTYGEDGLIYQDEGHYFCCYRENPDDNPVLVKSETGDHFCCPEGSTGFNEEGWECY